MNHLFRSDRVHLAFEASLVLKGVFSIWEIVSGVFVYFTPPRLLLNLVQAMTRAELSEDPSDSIANHLLLAARHLSIGAEHFAAWYLLSHGIVKLWLIVGLWRKKLGYYPAAVVIFTLFIAYQLYRFTLTHSLLLIGITALDASVIVLTWIEYRNLHSLLRRERPD